jgi:hypothetical protein
MNKSHLWRAAAAAAFCACAGTASAQEGELGTPVIPGWSFTPTLSAGLVYDNNVSLSDAPASTGRTPSDRLLLVRPSGRFEFNAPRTVFSAGYSGFIRRYADLDQLNNFEQRANLSLRRLATPRVTFMITNSFADVPTTDDVELNGVPFSRTGTRTNSLAASATARLTELTDLSVRYENTRVTFDQAPVVDTFLTDGILNAFRADASRRLSERLSAGGEYAIRFASMNEGTRNITFQDVGGTLRYTVGPLTSFTASAGMSHLADRTVDDTRVGPYLRAAVTHQTARAIAGASFERAFVPSFGFGGSSASQELSGFVNVPFTQSRLYVQTRGTWRRTDPLIEEFLAVDTIRLSATVGYSANRWLRGETFYDYSRQDSVITGGEIDRHRVGVQFVVSQPMRIR